MLHTLRKLARAIHRRSVWQVVAGYLLLCFLLLETVDFLTTALGLPLWTPSMAFALLGLGLPIVLATVIVQGGLPWLRIVDVADPNELEGRSPEEVHVVPEAHPLYGVGLLTWRNAVLGGMTAAALLVTSVVAYLAMWALGIGPVGSLAAQGILEPQDTVLVAGFVNGTDDPSLGREVRAWMEEALSHSSLVNVLRWNTTESSDALLGDEGAGLLEALDLARAGSARVVIHGEILSVGEGYRIVARIHLPDGTVLAAFGRAASSADDIAEQVRRLSVRLRERFGEPLREIYVDSGRGRRD